MILALAAEADDEFIWDRVRTIQPEMFAAGPVQIKLLTSAAKARFRAPALHRDELGHRR